MTLPRGTRLLTLDGTKIGNAIVVHHIQTSMTEFYLIETDFGNRLRMSLQNIDDHFGYDLEEEPDINRWFDNRRMLVLHNKP